MTLSYTLLGEWLVCISTFTNKFPENGDIEQTIKLIDQTDHPD